MSQPLAGQVAIVTGASKGIGAAIAEHLAAAGAAVVVNYASSQEGAERVAAGIVRAGGRAVTVQADVSKPDDVVRLFAEAKRAFDRVDVLINNAGIYEFAPLEGVTPEHFHKQFDLNVLGLIVASREAARHFGPQGGAIVNISSAVSTVAVPNAAVYSGTKAAVDAVTRSLAKELDRLPAQVFQSSITDFQFAILLTPLPPAPIPAPRLPPARGRWLAAPRRSR